MDRSTRRAGAQARTRGDAIDPSGSETGNFLNSSVRRNSQEPPVVSSGQHMIPIRRHTKHDAAMSLGHDGCKARTEQPDGAVTKSDGNKITRRDRPRYRCAYLKPGPPSLKLRFVEPLAPGGAARQVSGHAALHASNPSFRPMLSRSRPMNTTRELRGLPSGQAPMGEPSISMCTP